MNSGGAALQGRYTRASALARVLSCVFLGGVFSKVPGLDRHTAHASPIARKRSRNLKATHECLGIRQCTSR